MKDVSENSPDLKYDPVSSYRIQFSGSFTLNDLEKHIDYLHNLGISSIYASPVFAAVPGSNHGYDVTDPGMINPEVGTPEDFTRLAGLLREKNIGWIQDIVPNHMAYHPGNPWIWDILEKGPHSEYLNIFDIEPSVGSGKEKLMYPFLGSNPGQAVENGELQVCFNRGSIALKYYDNIIPVNFDSFRMILTAYLDTAPGGLSLVWKENRLDTVEAGRKFLNNQWESVKAEVASLFNNDERTRSFFNTVLKGVSKNPALITEIIAQQHYEICHWKETSSRINYRRFFTINDLIGIRIEDRNVFDKHHHYIKNLLAGGYISGLRVDHIDGLYNPALYLQNLRAIATEKSYIIVEKILESGETLPPAWPVEGTSGYEFLALVNNLLTSGNEYKRLLRLYHKITGRSETPDDIIYSNKKFILLSNMKGELENIFGYLEKLYKYTCGNGAEIYQGKKRITRESLKLALAEFMLAFPVYRLYPEEFPPDSRTREMFAGIFRTALSRNPAIKHSTLLLKQLVLADTREDDIHNGLLSDFLLRLMQFTGPLTAKGVEDTTMYQYNCFVSHNEVGDSVSARGITAESFHEAMIRRLADNPLAMNTTSTHDTKRGEDVRARLNVIADMPSEWESMVQKWMAMNSEIRAGHEKHGRIPSRNEEYLIYQTITGTFPFDEIVDDAYILRIQDYLVKALREAKQTSNWDDPDEAYEKAVGDFIRALLNQSNGFLKAFIPFHRKVAGRGIVNSLVQLVIKCCAPGVPDIYRGTELWDLSLVDPDNRRPVDFIHLKKTLERSVAQWKISPQETVRTLFSKAPDGRIKQFLTHILLNERKNNAMLFRFGDYISLEASGRYKKNVFGFIRKHNNNWLMCILPMHTGGLTDRSDLDYLSSLRWKDTFVNLPYGSPDKWENLLTGTSLSGGEHDMASLLAGLPVALFKGTTRPSNRQAGVLLHVTSLPGKYGTGDLGEEAYRFIDFLTQTNQTYWQTLPLSPVTKMQSWSPYASPSAFAGNIMLISPLELYKDGMINLSDLEQGRFRNSGRVNHEKATEFRELVLQKAWDTFRKKTDHYLYGEYENFCRKESLWLNDYSLFMAFRQNFGKKDWSRWPSRVRNREAKTLKTAKYEYSDVIRYENFKQFMFDRQWKKLKEFANSRGILIFGDMPFYVSYDSAEVWANQDLFKLNENGKMKTVAGVPPDYFDKNGQLWNMPVFNWERLKETGYDWWLKRLAKNLDLFDLLRLDHFRAFSAYWEVPAKEKTAVHGEWRQGPGADFFRELEKKFPTMPFVAEDLGDIDQPVYDLRDQFFLPGMQVLQFSFDRNMAKNIHTPHNHNINSLVYTGTHDNNTIQGWYERELGKDGIKRLNDYSDKRISKSVIHWELIRMAFASPAGMCIIPMQDYLGLGRNARMNTPSTSRGNWVWKLKEPVTDNRIREKIRNLTVMYNRK
jgi:malto-oligosyltrehalose synthase/4-alpha-glucanotransferase